MATAIELTGRDIFKVRLLESGLPYKDGNKQTGKTYTRFRFNGVVFIVPDNDPFVKDFANGKVHTIWLNTGTREVELEDGTKSTVDSIEFDAHISNAQIIGVTKTTAILDAISAGNIKADAEVTEDDLALLAAS
jgi:hypothetical protein